MQLTSPTRPAGVFVPAIFTGAFAFSIGFDLGITKLWDTWNKGVRVVPTSECVQVLTLCRNNGRTSVLDT